MKQNVIALLIGCVLAFICAEVLLRISPPAFMSDNLWIQYDQDVGWILRPTAKGKVVNGCLTINDIHVNQLGFRDKEWSRDRRYQIAVLGESYMEGPHVPDGTVVPHVLEGILNVPVMNAGIDGFGTLQEYLVYQKYIAPHAPKIVLLFIYPFNDIQDNSKRLAANHRLVGPRASIDASGQMIVDLPPTPPDTDSQIRGAIKRHVKTALLAWRAYEYLKKADEWIANVYFSQVYLPEDEVWREAWTITENYLVKLQHAVQANGGTLYLVPIPEYIQISLHWQDDLKRFYGKDIPEDFSRERPIRTLERIVQSHGLAIIRLDQFFRDYRDRFNLPAPYFYYACDGHFSPLGHFLAANVVARELVDLGVIDGDLAAIGRNLTLTPQEILSTESYRQIYTGERFTGNTNIPRLLTPH